MALYRHTASGTAVGETWTFTLYSDSQASLTAAQTAWVTATGSLWNGIGNHIADSIAMAALSTAEVDVATGNQSQRVEGTVARPGLNTSESLPYQCTVAVSLRTAFATRRGRGRFYLPPFAVTTIADSKLLTAVQTDTVTAVVNMFGAMNSAGLTPVVYSRASRAALTITSVDVGDVIDTQRRRRNKLLEERSSQPV